VDEVLTFRYADWRSMLESDHGFLKVRVLTLEPCLAHADALVHARTLTCLRVKTHTNAHSHHTHTKQHTTTQDNTFSSTPATNRTSGTTSSRTIATRAAFHHSFPRVTMNGKKETMRPDPDKFVLCAATYLLPPAPVKGHDAKASNSSDENMVNLFRIVNCTAEPGYR
jgi:hypothetical protein